MRFPVLLTACMFIAFSTCVSQVRDTLREVTIQAYTANRTIDEVPAAIGLINSDDLDRFNANAIVSAFNTVPGVRMEERSPGSYRFSIRGSSIRSPFGVRNVKVYWNGLPFTDAGGNTYLNLLDNNTINGAEIIKGPAGSIYGAGTGGVILLTSPFIKKDNIEIGTSIGSYGLLRNHAIAQLKQERFQLRLQFAQQLSNGYRDQSAMKRYATNADARFLLNKNNTLLASLFYTDLYYETPGALTLQQFNENPRAARPAAGPNRGAEEQQAGVFNKSPWGALLFEHEWNGSWTSNIGLIGSYAQFKNPAIRNFEERKEYNSGIRNENHYNFKTNSAQGKLTFGVEAQQMRSPVLVSGNVAGRKDTLQTDDMLNASTAGIFSQFDLKMPDGFIATAGIGVNVSKYRFERRYPDVVNEEKDFKPVVSPRIALLKTFNDNFSVFANVSRGFSPPSLAEVRPSANIFNGDLQAEKGTNFEMGVRGNLKQKLSFDITLYDLRLSQTIVIRHLPDGADYFVNAGKTHQRGIEATAAWTFLANEHGLISDCKLWSSYTYNHYRFKEYQSGDTDLTGKKLTGVPPVVMVAGVDLIFLKKLSLFITTNYTDHLPLNDVNSVYANEYLLLSSKASYTFRFNNHELNLFAGIDNALDKRYSLGNDLNAIGSRFYNAAPGRNYFGGLKFNFGL